MASEGIEVIQANNRRVAAAKKAAALTAKNLQAAKVALEAARKDHDEATKELKDAEQSQKSAQKKWEIVDLVDEEEDEEQPKSSSDSKKRSGASTDSEAKARKKARSDSNIPEEITVSGCGVAEANGTYKRIIYYNGALQYSKKGQWRGEDVRFEVYRGKHWCIGIAYKQGSCFETVYINDNDSSVPPSDGWRVYLSGVKPPPKII